MLLNINFKYMKYFKIGLFTAIFALLGANFATPVSAQYYYGRTPSLSVSGQSGSNLTFNVSNADPNSRVILYARSAGGSLWSTSIDSIGQTDSSGYLNTSLNPGINGNAEFKVTVNGLDSNIAQLGYNSCGYGQNCVGGITFSPANPSLSVGQTVSVSIYQPYFYYGSYYVSNNSNSSVVSATISGSSLSLYGLANGSSTITVCQSGGSSACGYVYVTVSGGSYSGNIWFSPSSPSMYVGQSLAVSINSSAYATGLYGSSSYYISSNSNSNVVSASVSGTVMNLYANQTGSATIVVCHNSLSFCGNLYVTVSGNSTSGNLWLSQSSVNVSVSNAQNINIYSNNSALGAYYISSNSNYNNVQASISGSILTVTGMSVGSSTVVVCQYNTSSCVNLYVTVGSSNYNNIWFSPSSVNMTSGQTTNVNIYSSGGYYSGYYVSSNSNSFVAGATINGSQLTITAQNSGNTTVMVCQTGNSSVCGNISVTVSGYGGSAITFSQNYLNLTSGQSTTVTVYGNGSYYISSNSNSSVVSANLSSNILNLYAYTQGTSAIVICQNSPYGCGTLTVNVSGGYYGGGNLYFNSTNLPNLVIGQYYNYQLQVSGGQAPYNFQVTSGQLPSGLYLSTGGLLYGTPQNSSYSSFTVRVSDTYGRNSSANFTIGGSGGVLGISTYPNGQLIKENGTVYIVYRGQKSGFASASAFTGLGFKFSNVLTTGYTGLSDSGYVVNSANTSHPWGSWVQSGQAIYFVHQDGLIPVPTWDVFINNRGQSSFVVPANLFDFQRPILSQMVSNDSRLY
jgi:hypothetical protein